MIDRNPSLVPRRRPAANEAARRWRQWIWRCAFLAALVALVSPLGLPNAWGQRSEKKASAESTEEDSGDAPSPSDGLKDAKDEVEKGAAERPVQQSFSRQEMLIASLTIFLLAVFIGFEVITKVPPTLHTPLMSGSNAISGITIVGALIVAGRGLGVAPLMGLIAVVLASINVVGGFLVTHRMLAMFEETLT